MPLTCGPSGRLSARTVGADAEGRALRCMALQGALDGAILIQCI